MPKTIRLVENLLDKSKHMQTTIHPSYLQKNKATANHVSSWRRFIMWAEGQGKNRLGWVAFVIIGHGCLFTVFTALTVAFTGNHFIYWPFLIGAMILSVSTVISGMPTKYVIPVFFFSLLVDVVIILSCLVNLF